MASPPSVSASDFMMLGFESRGFKKCDKLSHSSRVRKFRSLFGTSPQVVAAIWEDLRLSNDDDVKINRHCRPLYLLLALRWMKAYESEEELETSFNLCVNTISKWCEILTSKIALLRKTKVSVVVDVTFAVALSLFCN